MRPKRTFNSVLVLLFFFTVFLNFRISYSQGAKDLSGEVLSPETLQGEGNDIKENKTGFYGGGFIIGRPVKGSEKGFFFNTTELNIMQGGFKDTNFYLGSIVHMSTDKRSIFDKFQTLDTEKQYIFEYKHVGWINPEIEDSHLQVIGIYTPAEFLAKRNAMKIPATAKSGDNHHGPYGDGARKGRIVDIERFGFWQNFCAFELNVGGLTSAGEGGSVEAIVDFAVIDEDLCKWIENAIALGVDVEVDYTEDNIELWQPSSRYCKGIKCIPSEQTVQQEVPQTKSELEDLKKELLKDPEFLKQLKERLSELKS
jgi:hypothetical protein